MAIRVGQTGWQFTYFTSGSVICEISGVAWVVAPASTEVSRNWYSRLDAATTAEANAACGDWFVPTRPQLLNPGYACRNRWDQYGLTGYWGSENDSVAPYDTNKASTIRFDTGGTGACHKSLISCARAFRCVTY